MSRTERAERFAADAERARWHDASLWLQRSRRDTAAASLPEWESLRSRAAELKAYTLSRLDEMLERFEAEAMARGTRVHWASDAEEFREIVHGLLAERGVTRVVKSKSMLTEECGLNPHLEARGIEVVDTDLGERIVQLRDEPPSHIIFPAIHLKREEIGRLFHEELGGEAGAREPDYLTELARGHLREKFLRAEAGITGANFAVAETGGLVVVTNEGNADLGTTLPPLHIACVGIEKLVPRLEDLGVFTRLLARSATGQALSSYTTHFHGPREGGELHVVLVDNGRSRMLADPELRRSLSCIRCGACLNTCPVYRRSGGYSYEATIPGPIGSVLSPAIDLTRHAALPRASTLCGSCSDVCPVRIDLHGQLLRWRRRAHAAGETPPGKRRWLRVASAVLSRPGLYRFAGALGRLGLRLPRRVLYDPRNAWGRDREMPEAPGASFRARYRKRERARRRAFDEAGHRACPG